MDLVQPRRRNRNPASRALNHAFDRLFRWTFPTFDPVILGVTVTLAMTGLVMVFSASGVVAESRFQEPTHYLQRQALWLGVGFVALFAVARWDYRSWKSFTIPLVIGVLGLLILVLAVGAQINGARRWLSLMGVSFQPSEFAKVVVILYLAAYLDKIQPHLGAWSETIIRPACIVGLLAALVLVEPDFGNAVVIGMIFFGMLFLAGVRVPYLVASSLALAPLVTYLIVQSPERLDRVLTYTDPFRDPEGSGYQLVQSFVAFGRGGWAGVGLGHGMQKLFYLPEGHTDFVLALIGEELGLIGTMTVIGLYALLVFKGFRVAAQAPDAFGRSLAQGITLLLGGQAFVNACVVSGLLPTKGLTLPLVSYGGSSAVTSLVAVGILLSVARQCPSSR